MSKVQTLLERLQEHLPKKRLLQKLQDNRSLTVLEAIQQNTNVQPLKEVA